MKLEKEIKEKRNKAEYIKDHPVNEADRNYAEGVYAALDWVLGDGCDPTEDY